MHQEQIQVSSAGGPSEFSPGRAWRLVPQDGPASFPRTVYVDGNPFVVSDSGWKRTGVERVQLRPLDYSALLGASLAIVPTPEQWLAEVADEDCDAVSAPPLAPTEQVLYDSGLQNWAGSPGGTWLGVIDARPWMRIVTSVSNTGGATGKLYVVLGPDPTQLAKDTTYQPSANLSLAVGVGVPAVYGMIFGDPAAAWATTDAAMIAHPKTSFLLFGINSGATGNAFTGRVRITGSRL